MEFKVGDKVRIRSNLTEGLKYGFHIANQEMVNMGGKLDTIEEILIFADHTTYKLEGSCWAWTEEMLEPAYTEGGYVPYGKIPTPSKPVPIEEQLGYTIRESLDSAFDAWRKAGVGIYDLFSSNGISAKKEDKNPMKFTFSTKEGYRIDKSNNTKIPTVTTKVTCESYGSTYHGAATCDKADYSERQGCLEAIANAMLGDNFDKEYNKEVKRHKLSELHDRTCLYCGKVFDTVEEREAEEAWHVERKKARRERYLLRKRAKEIAFEEQAQKMAKEMIKK